MFFFAHTAARVLGESRAALTLHTKATTHRRCLASPKKVRNIFAQALLGEGVLFSKNTIILQSFSLNVKLSYGVAKSRKVLNRVIKGEFLQDKKRDMLWILFVDCKFFLS